MLSPQPGPGAGGPDSRDPGGRAIRYTGIRHVAAAPAQRSRPGGAGRCAPLSEAAQSGPLSARPSPTSRADPPRSGPGPGRRPGLGAGPGTMVWFDRESRPGKLAACVKENLSAGSPTEHPVPVRGNHQQSVQPKSPSLNRATKRDKDNRTIE